MTAPEPATESASLRAFRAGVERFVKAFNEGDFESASAGLSDDFEQHMPPGFTERVLDGRRAWVKFFQEYREEMSVWRVTPTELAEAGPNTFLVGFQYQGTGRASGLKAGMRTWDVVELDEAGLVRRIRQFFDRSEARAAAGLEPEGG